MFRHKNFATCRNFDGYEISRNEKNNFAKYEINISQKRNFVDHPRFRNTELTHMKFWKVAKSNNHFTAKIVDSVVYTNNFKALIDSQHLPAVVDYGWLSDHLLCQL
jgi:hypothetical protein